MNDSTRSYKIKLVVSLNEMKGYALHAIIIISLSFGTPVKAGILEDIAPKLEDFVRDVGDARFQNKNTRAALINFKSAVNSAIAERQAVIDEYKEYQAVHGSYCMTLANIVRDSSSLLEEVVLISDNNGRPNLFNTEQVMEKLGNLPPAACAPFWMALEKDLGFSQSPFVNQLSETAAGIAVIRPIMREAESGKDVCAQIEEMRPTVDKVLTGMKIGGPALKLFGKIMEARSQALDIDPEAGLAGFLGLDVDVDLLESWGIRFGAWGEKLKDAQDNFGGTVDQCDLLAGQNIILERQEKILMLLGRLDAELELVKSAQSSQQQMIIRNSQIPHSGGGSVSPFFLFVLTIVILVVSVIDIKRLQQ